MSDPARLLPTFVTIPATPFRMGTPERALSDLARRYGGTRESYREEAPQHELRLPAYAIARTPVSNALYAAYVAATQARPPLGWRGPQPPSARADHPVTDVSWEAATAFCVWLSATLHDADDRRPTTDDSQTAARVIVAARPGAEAEPVGARRSAVVFRLPSEAEWEHGARGADGRSFPWGEEFAPELANTREGSAAATTAAGAYPAGASPYGLLDMAGNVWEWTASLDRPYPYRADDGREDPQASGRRIMRGGCYANPHGFARCACRFRLAPALRNEFTGFRLALSLERSERSDTHR